MPGLTRKHCSENIVFSNVVAKLGKICFKRRICVREARMFFTGFNIEHFLASGKQDLRPQQMFLARLNWVTFVSATMSMQRLIRGRHYLRLRVLSGLDRNYLVG